MAQETVWPGVLAQQSPVWGMGPYALHTQRDGQAVTRKHMIKTWKYACTVRAKPISWCFGLAGLKIKIN